MIKNIVNPRCPAPLYLILFLFCWLTHVCTAQPSESTYFDPDYVRTNPVQFRHDKPSSPYGISDLRNELPPWFRMFKPARNSGTPLQPFGTEIGWTTKYQPLTPGDYWQYIRCATDKDGNLYTLHQEYSPATAIDFMVSKYDFDGNLLWQYRHDGSYHGDDQGLNLSLDDSGFVYASGITRIDQYATQLVFLKFEQDGRPIWETVWQVPEDLIPTDFGFPKNDQQGNQFIQISWGGGSYLKEGDTYLINQEPIVIVACDRTGKTGLVVNDPLTDHPQSISSACYNFVTDDAGSVYCLLGQTDLQLSKTVLYLTKYHIDGSIRWRYRISDDAHQYDWTLANGNTGRSSIYYRKMSSNQKNICQIDSSGALIILFVTESGGPGSFFYTDPENHIWIGDGMLTRLSPSDGKSLWSIQTDRITDIGLLNDTSAVICGPVFYGTNGRHGYFLYKIDYETGNLIWQCEHGNLTDTFQPQLATDRQGYTYVYASPVYASSFRQDAFIARHDASGQLDVERFSSKPTEKIDLYMFAADQKGCLYLAVRENNIPDIILAKYDKQGNQITRQATGSRRQNFQMDDHGRIYGIHDMDKNILVNIWDSDLKKIRQVILPSNDIVDYSWHNLTVSASGKFVAVLNMFDDIWEDDLHPFRICGYSANGNINWMHDIKLHSHPEHISVDLSGNCALFSSHELVYLKFETGKYWSKIYSVEPWTSIYTIQGTLDQRGNVYVAVRDRYSAILTIQKISPSGKIIWESPFELEANEKLESMYTVKLTSDVFDRLFITLRTFQTTGLSSNHYEYLAMYDQAGQMLLRKTLTEVGVDYITELKVDNEGNSYVSFLTSTVPKSQLGIVSFDQDGNLRWLATHTPQESFSNLSGIFSTLLDNQGNIFCAYQVNGMASTWGNLHLMKIVQTGEHDISTSVSTLSLGPNIPNPFNSTTAILYRLPAASPVTISVFDRQGRRVQRDDLGIRAAGENTYYFRGDEIASGVYYYQVKTDREIRTGKMVLVK